jgi:hypothetical protein
LENSEIWDATHVKPSGELRVFFSIDLDDQSFTRHILGSLCYLGRGHFAGTAPVCPKIRQNRNPALLHNLVELLDINIERLVGGP